MAYRPHCRSFLPKRSFGICLAKRLTICRANCITSMRCLTICRANCITQFWHNEVFAIGDNFLHRYPNFVWVSSCASSSCASRSCRSEAVGAKLLTGTMFRPNRNYVQAWCTASLCNPVTKTKFWYLCCAKTLFLQGLIQFALQIVTHRYQNFVLLHSFYQLHTKTKFWYLCCAKTLFLQGVTYPYQNEVLVTPYPLHNETFAPKNMVTVTKQSFVTVNKKKVLCHVRSWHNWLPVKTKQ